MRKHPLLSLLCGLALPGLALTAPSCALLDGNSEHTYEGAYTWGFEVDAFSPCGRGEQWWVTFPDDSTMVASFFERYLELTEESYQRVYVRLHGVPGPKGKYGHLGAYQREFEVREVVDMRPWSEDDCS